MGLRYGEALTPEISLLVKYKDGAVYPATGLGGLKLIIYKDERMKQVLVTLDSVTHNLTYDTATGTFSLSDYINYDQIDLPLGSYWYECAHTIPQKVTMFFGPLTILS